MHLKGELVKNDVHGYLMEFHKSEIVNIYTLQYIFLYVQYLYVQYMYGCIKVMTVRLLCV